MMKSTVTFCVCVLVFCVSAVTGFAAPGGPEILKAAGVAGGLIVHVGCGDGTLTADLRGGGKFAVQGLDASASNVEKARAHIQSLGLYGAVSANLFDGKRLPYVDNLVNLLVSENLGGIPMSEVTRVLAPLGVAYIKANNPAAGAAQAAWTKTVKPWPKDIDEWTHHLHDAGGNAVAQDTVVGPPKHLQWTAAPLWSRSHGWTPSTSAMVSAHGRLFYINDETLTGVDGTVPDKWVLVARDAFSGVLLWKRPVPNWGSKFFSGTAGNQGVGRFTMPPDIGKRLVAVGDTVYVTLDATAPVTAIDAATGADRRVYPETKNADEILFADGRLVMSLNQPGASLDHPTAKRVCALDPATSRVLWNEAGFEGFSAFRSTDPFGRLELAAGDGQVFMVTQNAIVSLALDSGKRLWRLDRPALSKNAVLDMGFAGVFEYRHAVLVYHAGVVLLAQPEPRATHTYHTVPGALYAFDAKSGQQLWSRHYGTWGHCTPPDVFVVNGVVWVHEDPPAEFPTTGKSKAPLNMDQIDYAIQGLDLKTGELTKRISTKEIFDVEHHHRCYRNKITEQYLMSSRRGVEFVDLASGENYLNHWVRSGCLLGNLPCNGLLYTAPHPCGCYIEAKLTGFLALAPAGKTAQDETAAKDAQQPAASRLERGPAYSQSPNPQPLTPDPSSADWPTYRHDARRSGGADATVSAAPQPLWETNAGGRLSAPVVAEGKVFVADVDAHTVRALDAADGKLVWSFTAGARVDSPPTVTGGLAIFGSADGRVYCLRAADGALAWRFEAAPRELRVSAFDQLESPWPVPGSVLLHEGKVWFAAGRSSYLDGGIYLYALDPRTGQMATRQTIYSPDPKTDKMIKTPNKIAGLLNDIPVTNGANVFIRQMQVGGDAASAGAPAGKSHLYSTGGFLDSSWFNRTFWRAGGGAETTGLMVLGDDVAYGVEIYPANGRETVFKPGAKGYRLTCFSLTKQAAKPSAKPANKQARREAKGAGNPNAGWTRQVPIRITAMVRAGNALFVAGSPDVVDPKDPYGAWEGRKGGVLATFATADGKPVSERKLAAPPTWDGMAAANGRLFVSLANGHVACMGASQ